ncbi:hypothetical protein DGG96_16805 [Legionella qingyii]|uniref:Uncharacterized protein n=1 Tax=Legionella qingyii TaxID=2184757 RepID=A0A317TZW3_9GAMM|nr:hypothetical protein DGG96_16805 [Legionella qingyii]
MTYAGLVMSEPEDCFFHRREASHFPLFFIVFGLFYLSIRVGMGYLYKIDYSAHRLTLNFLRLYLTVMDVNGSLLNYRILHTEANLSIQETDKVPQGVMVTNNSRVR